MFGFYRRTYFEFERKVLARGEIRIELRPQVQKAYTQRYRICAGNEVEDPYIGGEC